MLVPPTPPPMMTARACSVMAPDSTSDGAYTL
jgi:hypothetical protein